MPTIVVTIIHVYDVLLICDMILPVRAELLLQLILSMMCACCQKDAPDVAAAGLALLRGLQRCGTNLYLTFSVIFRQRKKREREQEEDPGKTTRLTLSLKKNVIPSVCTILIQLVLVLPVHLLCQPFAASHTGSSTEHLSLSCCL